MKCSYCQKTICRNLTLTEIFGWGPLLKEELCQECLATFVPVPLEGRCRGCQKSCSASYCPDCRRWQRQYPGYKFQHQALFCYDDAFKQWMRQYKIAGDYRLCGTFKKQIRQYLRKYLKKRYLICPLPLSKQRLQVRGFNQTAAFLQAAEIPFVQLLERPQHQRPQAKKNRQERLALVQPFCLKPRSPLLFQRRILLVDDVYTTGRTMFHAAEIILAQQPAQLRTFSLAR